MYSLKTEGFTLTFYFDLMKVVNHRGWVTEWRVHGWGQLNTLQAVEDPFSWQFKFGARN